MRKQKTYATQSGRTLSDADIDAAANEVATKDYAVETLRTQRRGRPPIGAGPGEVVPVRIDAELRAAIRARADAEDTTTSEIIREALRRFLGVA
ncbi:MAG TPA: ribbon-helix-helix protein, CopG family [Acidimicrobiales bacterium]|nr:ribbon-helix-helix protein, CopG family [Acidimicrobiales bacterium]